MDAAGHAKSHEAGVTNDNDNDGERAEKIETWLALAILKARIDSEPEGRRGLAHRFIDARNVAEIRSIRR
jgi:hypothetical protein